MNTLYLMVFTLFVGYTTSAQLYIKDTLIIGKEASIFTTSDVDFINEGVVLNKGFVSIKGNFSPGLNPSDFVNKYINYDLYGQLIINPNVTVTSTNKITQEFPIPDYRKFSYYYFSVPFANYTSQEFTQSLGLGTSSVPGFYQANNYFRNALFHFNNINMSYDNINPYVANQNNLSNGKLLLINNNLNVFFKSVSDGNTIIKISGTPEHKNLNLNSAFIGDFDATFGVGQSWLFTRNPYGIFYNNLLYDYTRDSSDPNYKRYIYQFGNPYPSNLDLSNIYDSNFGKNGLKMPIRKLSRYLSSFQSETNVITSEIVSFFETDINLPTYGKFISGDYESLIVRPYDSFPIIYNNSLANFNFTNELKTFSNTPKILNEFKSFNVPSVSENRLINSKFPNLISISLGLEIYANEISNGTTYFLGKSSEKEDDRYYICYPKNSYNVNVLINSKKNTLDCQIQSFKINETQTIPLDFKPKDGQETYVLKSPVNRNIYYGVDESAYPQLFTFLDTQTNISIPIDFDFSYTFTQTTPTTDRFFIIYNGGTNLNNPISSTSATNKSLVFSKDNSYYLKLENDVKTNNAAIQVFNNSGHLIDSFNSNGKNLIKLSYLNPGIYFIKIESLENSLKMLIK